MGQTAILSETNELKGDKRHRDELRLRCRQMGILPSDGCRPLGNKSDPPSPAPKSPSKPYSELISNTHERLQSPQRACGPVLSTTSRPVSLDEMGDMRLHSPQRFSHRSVIPPAIPVLSPPRSPSISDKTVGSSFSDKTRLVIDVGWRAPKHPNPQRTSASHLPLT